MPRGALVGVVLLVAALAGCGADADAGAATTTTSPPLPWSREQNLAALADLAASGPTTLDASHLDHDLGGHDAWGPAEEPALDDATQAELDAQWAVATAAAEQLATPEQAEAAGYRKSATEVPGVGTHYIRWDLVDQPFDPAHPSMLLYDESEVRPTRLLGFSYWLRSAGSAPAGFAGDGDHWHMHHGLCFEDGFLASEGNVDPSTCPGTWLAGTDLWMMHAWVTAPANPWGRFAQRNPFACPGRAEPVADYARCPDPLPTSRSDPATANLNELYCSLLGAPASTETTTAPSPPSPPSP